MDQFVFSTLLSWLQEDGVFMDLSTSGSDAATETTGDSSVNASAPVSVSKPPQPAAASGRAAPRKTLQG